LVYKEKSHVKAFRFEIRLPHITEASLKNSYIMVDAGGKLVDNSGESYTVIADLLREDFEVGFNAMRFDTELYESRYTQT